jgi:thioredoxin 1
MRSSLPGRCRRPAAVLFAVCLHRQAAFLKYLHEIWGCGTVVAMAANAFTKNDFDDKIKAGLVMVDFWAEWCGPCRLASPVIEELSEEYKGKVEIGKLDVDAEPDIAQKYGVMSIPTVVLFKDGQEIGRQVGFAGKPGYVQLLSKAGV